MPGIGVHHTGTDGGAWDGPANKARLRSGESAGYYRRAYAWQDPDGDPEVKSSWRFIHHLISADGEPGPASIRACSSAIAVLNGGRGGTTIPDGDRRSVWSHLAEHLRDADLEPTELKSQEDAETERRVFTGDMEIREGADGEPLIVGYAAVFNQWSQDLGGFVEQIAPGFFSPVLGDDVRGLWQHDPALVLGRTTNGTLQLSEDETGLEVRIRPPDSQWARDALVSLRRGDVTQMSFGFEVDKDDWEQKDPGGIARRTLIRARRLYDVSPVTFPAYPQTSVSVRRHLAGLRARAAEDADKDTTPGEPDPRARERFQLRIQTRKREK